MLRAAQLAGVQVIWDIFHYGWPDDLDIWRPEFVDRFAAFAGAVARLIHDEHPEVPLFAPVNEISFVAWAGGDAAIMNPFATHRGGELKAQLIRASIAATEAIWQVDPRARIMQIDPMINALPHARIESSRAVARNRTAGQFEAWDMLRGDLRPDLGGHPRYLDVIGINYYPHNQWIEGWGPLHWTSGAYLPFRYVLMENFRRYGRPIFIAETGIEAERRPQWFRYLCGEVAAARAMGVPVEGVCLYPIMNHPGWLDERHCPNGLIDYSRETFERSVYEPLAKELASQQIFFASTPRDKLEGIILPLEEDQTFDDPTAEYGEPPPQ
jgi:beta-glucosidase/6-phospho-beta-glucosidase/beta-galactosidase